jgi:hypothetical protein
MHNDRLHTDGKKTFTAYLWKVCGEAYDQSNP